MVKIESAKLGIPQKLFLILVASVISGFIVFVFLYILDGSEWRFVEDSLLLSLLILFGLGLIFSLVYFIRDFPRSLDKTMTIHGGSTVVEDRKGKRRYDNNQAVNVRVDRQFYYFIGCKRLIIAFRTEGVRAKTFESIVIRAASFSEEDIVNALNPSQDSENE